MMSFTKMIQDLADQIPDISDSAPASPLIPCQMCREIFTDTPLNDNGFCLDCQAAIDRGYQISQKTGRCVNGAERDRGIEWHARLIDGNEISWKAVCATQPGRRSVGWSNWKPVGREVTCPRCLKKLKK